MIFVECLPSISNADESPWLLQKTNAKKHYSPKREKWCLMPDYNLTQPEYVEVKLAGRILDERYARLLMSRTDLGLEEIILLDRVQKRQPITREEHKRLKSQKLVEGRFPNLVVAAEIAAATDGKARHIRNKGFNNEYYRDLIVKIIREHQPVSRKDIDEMLLDKLPEVVSREQKLMKIHNLIYDLSHRQKMIQNAGNRRFPKWFLLKEPAVKQ